MKVFKLLGTEEEFSFERKILLSTCLIVSVTSLIAFFSNLFLGLGHLVLMAALSSFVVYGLLYLISRFTDKEELIKWLVSIVSLIFINLTWYLNNMSSGPSNYVLLVMLAFVIFIWDKKRILFFSGIIVVNIIGMISFEILFPEKITPYPNQFAQTIDVYIGLIICMLIIITYTVAAKQNYLKQYQKAKRADELKSAFLANMTHEIRTPLNSIIGFTQLLINKELSPEKKKKFSDIVSINTVYLSELIDDILDTSRIESNQLSLHFSSCNIAELFSRLKEEFKNELVLAHKENIELDFDDPGQFIKIHTDCKRLEQILRNLLSNAIKFTNHGYILFGCENKDNGITFYVKDSGIGIREEHKSRVFDRFNKIPGYIDKTNLYKGAGIGLSLSKDLAHLLEGKLWVESEYGKGSSFYFHIPRINRDYLLN